MGYGCPVCGAPQADGQHLANHLAFTALLHGDDHAAWLDEIVPDWADRSPSTLAETVVDHAEAIETDAVTTRDGPAAPNPDQARKPADPEVRRVIDEAIELTRERRSRSEKD